MPQVRPFLATQQELNAAPKDSLVCFFKEKSERPKENGQGEGSGVTRLSTQGLPKSSRHLCKPWLLQKLLVILYVGW